MIQDLEILADYHMILVGDTDFSSEDNVVIDEEGDKNMVYPTDIGFAIVTARDTTVPLKIEITDSIPSIDLKEWDHVVEHSLEVKSGSITVHGSSDYIGDFKKFILDPGMYNVLICYGGLNTLSDDELEGEDHYSLTIWKDDKILPLKVLKRWAH